MCAELDHEWLDRIVDAPDFDEIPAAVDAFLVERGHAGALEDAEPWCARDEPPVRAAGFDVLVVADGALLRRGPALPRGRARAAP